MTAEEVTGQTFCLVCGACEDGDVDLIHKPECPYGGPLLPDDYYDALGRFVDAWAKEHGFQEGESLPDWLRALRAERDRLKEALERIKKAGTRSEIVRVGDVYADDGFREYTIVSDEAEIANAALRGEEDKS